jgi:hypothetical protein
MVSDMWITEYRDSGKRHAQRPEKWLQKSSSKDSDFTKVLPLFPENANRATPGGRPSPQRLAAPEVRQAL